VAADILARGEPGLPGEMDARQFHGMSFSKPINMAARFSGGQEA
jgi:hypothetical protein